MIEFSDKYYYIDLNKIDKLITLNSFDEPGTYTETETTTESDEKGNLLRTIVVRKTTPRNKEIDSVKYDTIKTMLEILFDEQEESDETLGVDRVLSKMSLPFKLAFNTLIETGIIKEK